MSIQFVIMVRFERFRIDLYDGPNCSRPSQQTSDHAIQGFDRDKEECTCHLKEPGDSNDPPLSEEEVEEMLGNDLNI